MSDDSLEQSRRARFGKQLERLRQEVYGARSGELQERQRRRELDWQEVRRLIGEDRVEAAVQILLSMCHPQDGAPPGVYKEVFSRMRELNKEDAATKEHKRVIERVTTMARLDEEMTSASRGTFRTLHNFEVPADYFEGYLNLRPADARALRDAASATADPCASRNAEALFQRFGTCVEGRALWELTLPKQCEALGIELLELRVDKATTHEAAALRHYQERGFVGLHSEGGVIISALKALMLDALRGVRRRSTLNVAAHALAAQLTLIKGGGDTESHSDTEALLESVGGTSQQRYLENAAEILECDSTREKWPELSIEFMEALERAVPRSELIAVARALLERPSRYRKGWPDLTLFKDGRVLHVEVKANDKLIESQIRTIEAMRPLLSSEFLVAKVL